MKKLMLVALMSLMALGVRAEATSCLVTGYGSIRDPHDSITTLPEVLDAIVADAVVPDRDGCYEITFAESAFQNQTNFVSLSEAGHQPEIVKLAGKFVRLKGPGDNRHFVVVGGTGWRFELSKGARLELEKVTMTGQPSIQVVSNASFSARGCRFVGDAAAMAKANCTAFDFKFAAYLFSGCTFASLNTILEASSSSGTLVDCTVVDCGRRTAETLFAFAGAGTNVLVNTTACRNSPTRHVVASSQTAADAQIGIGNCIFFDEDVSGAELYASARGVMRIVHSVCRSADSNVARTNSAVGVELSGKWSELFAANRVETVDVDGVPQCYVPASKSGNAARCGAFVMFDDRWRNVAVTAKEDYDMASLAGVVGTPLRACVNRVTVDILGREISGVAVCGSHAALTDYDQGLIGHLEVNDFVDHETGNRFDGKVSLREAVAYAQRHPNFRDSTDGGFHITFARNGAPQPVKSEKAQIEVTEFVGSFLSIEGRDDAEICLDGNATQRFFYVAPRNCLRLRGIAFTNAMSSASGVAVTTCAGGAIANAGRLEVTDCAFRGCESVRRGVSHGGAIATLDGATTTVERCTFARCRASEGGALATEEGGVTVASFCTFVGNEAVVAGGHSALGGAVVARGCRSATVLLNCTLTGNRSDGNGGAIASVENEEGDGPNCSLAASLAVGNLATDGALVVPEDVYVGEHGKLRLFASAYGRIAAPGERVLTERVEIKESEDGCETIDVFAVVAADGSAVPTNVFAVGSETGGGCVNQLAFALDAGAATALNAGKASWKATSGFADVYARTTTAFRQLLGTRSDGASPTVDQVRLSLGADRPIGATVLKGEQKPVPPPVPDDPLLVKSATEAALRQAVEAARKDPLGLASNGVLTVRFAGRMVIGMNEPICVGTPFDRVPLRLAGPVSLSGREASRIFTVGEGCRLELEAVELLNGSNGSADSGGAIGVSPAASLFATNCHFSNCVARAAGADGGFGGAVALAGGDFSRSAASALFSSCRFDRCRAEDGADYPGLGDAVYLDEDVWLGLIDCRYDVGDVRDGRTVFSVPTVHVVTKDGRDGYFTSLRMAGENCVRGDSILVLASPFDAHEEWTLPPGVTLRDNPMHPSLDLAAIVSRSTAASVLFRPVVDEPNRQIVWQERLDRLPVVAGVEGAFIVFADDGLQVGIRAANIQSGLWYALGAASTLDGDWRLVSAGWVQAHASADLQLWARRLEGNAFYRILVTETEP